MDFLSKKLEFLSDLWKSVNNLIEMRVNVNTISVKASKNVINFCDNNCVKMCRISTECKERIEMNVKYEWNQQFVCFWPKCRYKTPYKQCIERHFSQHRNERHIACDECEKNFDLKSSLMKHKRLAHPKLLECFWPKCGY